MKKLNRAMIKDREVYVQYQNGLTDSEKSRLVEDLRKYGNPQEIWFNPNKKELGRRKKGE